MRNDQIEALFKERHKKHKYLFEDWLDRKICDKHEMKFFKKWINQLSEDEFCDFLKTDWSILSAREDQSIKICERAISINPYSLKHIKNQTESICLFALQLDTNVLFLIKEQTVDLCLFALENNSLYYSYKDVRIVPNPDVETTLLNLKNKKDILEALK